METIQQFLKKNKNKEIIIFLKVTGFRYKGQLISFDEKFLQIDEIKNGLLCLSLDAIAEFRTGQEVLN